MSVFKNPFFILPCLLFWINQYLEKIQEIYIPLVNSYFDDFLAMPVVLGITLQIYHWIHPLKKRFIFTPLQILVAVLYFSVIFEGLLPLVSEVYIRDLWDILYYLLGAVWFYFLINKKE